MMPFAALPLAKKSSIKSTLSPLPKKSFEQHTVYARFFVKEKTSVVNMLSMVEGFFFLANTTGTFKRKPTMIAGAIPEASMVKILLISLFANLRTNSIDIDCNSVGSI